MPWKRTSNARVPLKLALLLLCGAALAAAGLCTLTGKVCEFSARSGPRRSFFSVPSGDLLKKYQEMKRR